MKWVAFGSDPKSIHCKGSPEQGWYLIGWIDSIAALAISPINNHQGMVCLGLFDLGGWFPRHF